MINNIIIIVVDSMINPYQFIKGYLNFHNNRYFFGGLFFSNSKFETGTICLMDEIVLVAA